jgi:hypothetical protein
MAQWQWRVIGNFLPQDALEAELYSALSRESEIAVAAAVAFLNLGEDRQKSPMATLTALAALGDKKFLLQSALKQLVFTPADLDFTLRSPWPFWILLASNYPAISLSCVSTC